MDKNNLQRPQRAGARFYLTIKLKDYLSQSRRRGSEVVHDAASLLRLVGLGRRGENSGEKHRVVLCCVGGIKRFPMAAGRLRESGTGYESIPCMARPAGRV